MHLQIVNLLWQVHLSLIAIKLMINKLIYYWMAIQQPIFHQKNGKLGKYIFNHAELNILVLKKWCFINILIFIWEDFY